MSTRLTVQRLGAQGDGIADTPRGPVFVPFALPGETVTAAINKDRADLIAVIEASPQRVEPTCRHFGTCGGCELQHLEEGAYRTFKRETVVTALRQRSLDVDVEGLIACPPASRRRVTWTALRTEAGMQLGYRKALSHEIVDIEEDPIAVPAIEGAIDLVRELAGVVCATHDAFRLAISATASGLDIAVSGAGEMSAARRQKATQFAIAKRLARLSFEGEIVVEPQKPQILIDDIAVNLPPGGFLQAVEVAELAMADLVTAHLRKAKKVADLFAGIGTFALRLARHSSVHAVEGEAAALAALDRAFRHAAGLKTITSERRDLARRPLTWKELNGFDGLVFDPPRAGAEDQARQIARSDIRYVAAVSCNPATLARDLSILVEGGYRLISVTPIDQFLWSHHVEAVALLEKPKKRR
ncbi:RNA methyltransferase [Chelativorans sp. ZYF759]|uniref:class I SAM-dependent RNA methyltransferase n=1 Tax=Chelativorans sp. ZYF759 TaxID=2692213 RepID=UPI00145FC61E|nr:class I SAM-dependent RNA methyltransferase [Chelativorans sp. ZYF759]NMG38878.1 RNA methyltransferase [Chelativorans sp. ZYF759]